MLHVLNHPHPCRRRLLTAILVCAAIVPLALLNGQESRAQTQLDEVRAQQDRIRDELADENAAVDAALARAGELRTRELEVDEELSEKEAELVSARELLAQQRAALAETKRHLRAASGDLKHLLVFIYKNGQIDEVQVLLDADGMDDLVTRADYLGRVNDYQTDIVERVKRLREETAEKVGSTEDTVARIDAARDEIAARQQQLATARAEAEQREAELRSLRDDRREALAGLIGREKHLIDVLSTPAPTPKGDSQSVAPPSGSRATLNSDGTANAPANAPAAVKAALAAGNEITNTPYIWGGGHGSFEAAGYDCSGSVSFVLHGGGFLDSPLDSTGLMTWGDAGAGNWITVYANSGHTFITVAGLRFDTSGAPPRWQTAPRSSAGYVVRHPPGY
jgi:peptidoglycan hydrolase CwlO-like protein